ncbi:MAG: 4a-hydroxytetrahydrobiopterin dehydratase [Vampirovibrionales bacterium]|nr:4a-hydroxytetrahydrobiopterin dehydratase [Vampirovibrionales bacterium]
MTILPLSDEALANARHSLPEWQLLPDGYLSREVRFESFKALMAFVNRLADEAERQQHHPRLVLEYTTLRIDWMTHEAGGVTARDVAMARWCNDQLSANCNY